MYSLCNFLIITFLLVTFTSNPIINAFADEQEWTWTVSISMFSGRPNPRFDLNSEEIANLKAMLGREVETTLHTTREEQDQLIYGQYNAKIRYSGISIRVRNQANESIELITVSGRFLRRQIIETNSSILLKMRALDVETYLIELGKQKGVISNDLDQEIERGKKGRKE